MKPSRKLPRPPLGAAPGETLAVGEPLIAEEHQRMPTIEVTNSFTAVGATNGDDPVLHYQETYTPANQRTGLPHDRLGSDGSQHPVGGLSMAKKTIHISDLSGKEVLEGKGATISIKFADARKGTYVLDVTDDEAEELGQKGRKQARRGRKPKTAV